MDGYDGTQLAVQGDPQYGQQGEYDQHHMGYGGYPSMPYFHPYMHPYYHMHPYPWWFFPPYGHGPYPMPYGQGGYQGERLEEEDRPFFGGFGHFGHPFFGFHHHPLFFPFFFPFGFGFPFI